MDETAIKKEKAFKDFLRPYTPAFFLAAHRSLRRHSRNLSYRIVPKDVRIRLRRCLFLDEDALEIGEREYFFYCAFKALSFNGITGDYAEFGCCGGMTFAIAYQTSRKFGVAPQLWAFDSFSGLPLAQDVRDSHPHWKQGTMKTSLEEFHRICASNGIPAAAYQAVPGYYEETLAKMPVTQAPVDICLAYIDCDLYTSARSVLGFLKPRLRHGMVIAFDDYFCWSIDQVSGERRAMLETFEGQDQWHLLPYIQFGWHGMSFVVEKRR